MVTNPTEIGIPTEERVRSVLGALCPEVRSSAAAFHDAAEAALRSAGFHVEREVVVPVRGRPLSRVDLVLNGQFAVELDRKALRRKSMAKVHAFGSGMVYSRS